MVNPYRSFGTNLSIPPSRAKNSVRVFHLPHLHTRHNLSVLNHNLYVCFWRNSPPRAIASSFTSYLDHTQWRTTVGKIPLDEWSARRRHLYLTTQNTHNRQTSMPPVGFEPTISVGEQPQTYALDRVATGTGNRILCICVKWYFTNICENLQTYTSEGCL